MMSDQVFLCDRRLPGFSPCGGSRLRKPLLSAGRWEHPGEAPLELDGEALARLAAGVLARTEMVFYGPGSRPYGTWVAFEAEGPLLVGYLEPMGPSEAEAVMTQGVHAIVLVRREPLGLLSVERAWPPVYFCAGGAIA